MSEGLLGALAGLAWAVALALPLAGMSGRAARALSCGAAVALLSAPLGALESALASALGGGWAACALSAAVPESALVAAFALMASRGSRGREAACAGAVAGLGLAAAEGVSFGLAGGLSTAAARIVGATPAHAADGALAALAASALSRRGWGSAPSALGGWALACASHAAFDMLALSGWQHGGDAAVALGLAMCALAVAWARVSPRGGQAGGGE